MLKQAESLPSSPDELLRYCDVELHRLRAQRHGAQKNRATILAVSIFVLVFSAMAAFVFLFAKLQDLPRGGHQGAEEMAGFGQRRP
jgi:flagellar basal body-associated protein FliL